MQKKFFCCIQKERDERSASVGKDINSIMATPTKMTEKGNLLK